jgi:hypothetical protein
MRIAKPAWGIALCVLTTLTFGCVASDPGGAPIEYARDIALLQARLNDSGPLTFILDTGSPYALLRPDAPDITGVEHGPTTRLFGYGPQSTPSTRLSGITLHLASHDLPLKGAMTLDELAKVSEILGRRIDGVLGYELFSHFVVEVDPHRQRLTLHDPETFVYHGRGEIIPLAITRAYAQIDASLVLLPGDEPIHCNMLIDSGLSDPLWLTGDFVEAHPRLRALEGEEVEMSGAGGALSGKRVRIESLRIGRIVVEKPGALLGSGDSPFASASPRPEAILGASVLRQLHVWYDYPHKRMILEPAR